MSTTIQPGSIVVGERCGAGSRESRTVTGPLLPQDPHEPCHIARIRVAVEDDPSTGAEAKIAVHRDTLRPGSPKGDEEQS
jgi:hypothetical protein